MKKIYNLYRIKWIQLPEHNGNEILRKLQSDRAEFREKIHCLSTFFANTTEVEKKENEFILHIQLKGNFRTLILFVPVLICAKLLIVLNAEINIIIGTIIAFVLFYLYFIGEIIDMEFSHVERIAFDKINKNKQE